MGRLDTVNVIYLKVLAFGVWLATAWRSITVDSRAVTESPILLPVSGGRENTKMATKLTQIHGRTRLNM